MPTPSRLLSFFIMPVVLLSVAMTSCSRTHNLDPFGWESIGEPFDSLTYELERGWLDEIPLSQRRLLVEKMSEAAAARRDIPQAAVRAEFWEGRLSRALGDESVAMLHFNNVLEKNDSSRYPYTHQRLQWLLDDDYPPYTIESYNHIKAQAEFFERAGDRLLAGGRWMDLATFLNDLGQTRRAIQLLDRSDSLYRLGGFDEQINGNIINRANVLFRAGRRDDCERLLRRTLADSVFADDPYAQNILLNNLLILHGDTAALFQAYDMVKDDSTELALQSFYSAAISGYYLNRGQIDSAIIFSDRSMETFPELEMDQQRIDVLAWRGDVMMAAGRQDEANKAIQQRLEETEDMISSTRRTDVMAHDFQERLVAAERADVHRVFRARMIAILAVALVIMIALAILYLQHRRSQRIRLAAMEQRLDLEKSQRRVLAMKLALDEKEQLLATIREQIASAPADTRNSRLESLLKIQSAGISDERTTFMQTFTEINPEFERQLRSVSPSLTTADLRLASMISVGLTNKQIAAALGVRPESVKQARWRLRSKLGLDRDESLEAFLASPRGL